MPSNLWPSMRKSYESSSSENEQSLQRCYIFIQSCQDPARGTNSEHLRNVLVFVWDYKIKCTCFENNFCPSLSAKSQKKVNLPKRFASGET